MYYGPFMSSAELDAIERDNARFHPDPDAGRHHPECCCARCDPEPESPQPPADAEKDAAQAARIEFHSHREPESECPF